MAHCRAGDSGADGRRDRPAFSRAGADVGLGHRLHRVHPRGGHLAAPGLGVATLALAGLGAPRFRPDLRPYGEHAGGGRAAGARSGPRGRGHQHGLPGPAHCRPGRGRGAVAHAHQGGPAVPPPASRAGHPRDGQDSPGVGRDLPQSSAHRAHPGRERRRAHRGPRPHPGPGLSGPRGLGRHRGGGGRGLGAGGGQRRCAPGRGHRPPAAPHPRGRGDDWPRGHGQPLAAAGPRPGGCAANRGVGRAPGPFAGQPGALRP